MIRVERALINLHTFVRETVQSESEDWWRETNSSSLVAFSWFPGKYPNY